MRRSVRDILILFSFILTTWSSAPLAADSDLTIEYRVKAAYLYNFTRFVEWPAHAQHKDNGKIAVCLLGEDPFGTALNSIAGKTVGGSKLIVRRHRSVGDLGGCHVVFVSRSEDSRLDKILDELRNRPVLTIGESNDFNELGGVIRFTLVKNKVHFNINPDAAKRAGLTISSKLLNLATIVRESRP